MKLSEYAKKKKEDPFYGTNDIYRRHIGGKLSTLESDIEEYRSSANRLYDEYNKRRDYYTTGDGALGPSGGKFRGDYDAFYDTVTTANTDIAERGKSIREKLEQYGRYLPADSVAEITSMLDNNDSTLSDILGAATSDRDIFSRYADENDYVAKMKAYQEYLDMGEDLTSRRGDIGLMDDVLNNPEKQRIYADARYRFSGGDPEEHTVGYGKDDTYLPSPFTLSGNMSATMQAGKASSIKRYAEARDLLTNKDSEYYYKNNPYYDDIYVTEGSANPIDTSGLQNTRNTAWGQYAADMMVYAPIAALNDENFGTWVEIGKQQNAWDADLEHLDEDIRRVVYYYLGKGDEETARIVAGIPENADVNAYIKGLQWSDNVNNIPLVEELGKFAYSALDTVGTGGQKLYNMVTGSEDVVTPTRFGYAANIAQSDDEGLKAMLGEAAMSLGQMAPSAAAGLATSLITKNPALGTAVARTMFGVNAASNSYNEKIEAGWKPSEAFTYGVLTGVSEIATEKLLGGSMKLIGGAFADDIADGINKAVSKLAKNHSDDFMKFIAYGAKVGGGMAQEFLEESVQAVLDPVFELVSHGETDGVRIGEVLYQGFVGALTGGLGEVGSASRSAYHGARAAVGGVKNIQNTKRLGNAVMNTEGGVDALKKIGEGMSLDSAAYKLASKITPETSAYTIGKLYKAVGAQISTENRTELMKSLTRKGVSAPEAESIIEAFDTVIRGGELSAAEKAVLDNNDSTASVIIKDLVLNPNSTLNQLVSAYIDISEADAVKNTMMPRAKRKAAKANAETGAKTDSKTGKAASPASITEAENTDEAVPAAEIEANPIKTGSPLKPELNEHNEDGTVKGSAEAAKTEAKGEGRENATAEGVVVEANADMSALALETMESDRTVKADTVSDIDFDFGWRTAYNYGRNGYEADDVFADGIIDGLISSAAARHAFAAGRADMKAANAGRQAAIDKAKAKSIEMATAKAAEKASKTAKAKSEANNGKLPKPSVEGRVHFGNNVSATAKVQKASVQGLRALSQALNVDVYIYDSKHPTNAREKNSDGWYDPKDNSIHIDIHSGKDARGTMLYTASHELVHMIKHWSPEKYQKLADFLIKEYGKKGVSVEALVAEQIAKAKKQGDTLTEAQAFDEVIADSCERMLLDSEAFAKLADFAAESSENKGIVQKIVDYIKSLLAALRDVYKGLDPNSVEADIVSEMVDAAEELHTLFEDALMDTAEASRLLGNDAAAGDADVQMARKTIDTTVDKAIANNGDIGEKYNQKKISPVPYEIAAMVSVASDGNIDIAQKEIAINGDDIWHEYERHSDAGIERGRRQIAMTAEDIKDAIFAIYSPDIVECVFPDTNNPTQKQSFAYAKQTSQGHYVVVEAVGGKRNPNITPVMILHFDAIKWNEYLGNNISLGEILYENDAKLKAALNIELNKKNRVTAAQFASQKPLLNTPRSPQSNISISQPPQNVKSKFSRKSADDRSAMAILDRATEAENTPSDRELIADALDTLTVNPAERELIDKYRQNIEKMNAEEEKLYNLKVVLKALSFSEGKRDTERIKKLREDITATQNRIQIYDDQLLRLESAGPLRNIIASERAKAAKLAIEKASTKAKEADAKWREKKLVRMNRERIIRLANRINRLNEKASKENNVKEEQRSLVSDAIALAKVLFAEEVNERDLAALDYPYATEKELQDLARYRELLEKQDEINAEVTRAVEGEADARGITGKDPDIDINSDGAELDAINSEIASLEDLLGPLFDRKQKELGNIKATSFIETIANDYAQLANSEVDYIRATYDQESYDYLVALAQGEELNGKTAKDMTSDELQTVYEAFAIVANSVYGANKLFNEGKNRGVTASAATVMGELSDAYKGPKADNAFARTIGQTLKWDNLKPETAIEMLNSEELLRLYRNMQDGEIVWAKDIEDATRFKDKLAEKYGADKWKRDKTFEFVTARGKQFELTLGQCMSVYALSRRLQADEHLQIGGIVPKKMVTKLWDKNKHRIRKLWKSGKVKDVREALSLIQGVSTSYKVSEELINVINSKLTEEQKAFIRDMQDYLSKDMGAKGNEVSMKLYGIKLFKEGAYFPLQSAPAYLARNFEQMKGEKKIKNKGFTQKLVDHARNPIIIDDFIDVWAGHVNEMAQYHGLVLPLEDFTKVYGYIESADTEYDAASVRAQIENVHGENATKYIDKLLQDLNGGVVYERAGAFEKLVSLNKKSKVLASASVVVQQPTAGIRALLYTGVHPFGGKITRAEGEKLWDELKRYAPIATIKDIGKFDVGISRSASEQLAGQKSTYGKVMSGADKAFGLAAEWADKITWCQIWKQCQRKVYADNKALKLGSEDNKQAAAKLFTETIRRTQVYDSVFSRTQAMRSKNPYYVAATAFMSEPMTLVDMVVHAWHKGDKKFFAETMAVIVLSTVVNNAVKSVVYAARDDDDDETYLEKYLQALTKSIIEGMNPLTYIPFAKDIWSLIQGYDVERPDMSLIGDVINAVKGMSNDSKRLDKKLVDLVGAIAAIYPGLPISNIARDVYGVANFFTTVLSGRPNTELGTYQAFSNAVRESLRMDKLPKSDILYKAATEDPKHLARMRATYKSDEAYKSALRAALRENDARIAEAVIADMNGDVKKREAIKREITSEGHFTEEIVYSTVKGAVSNFKSKLNDAAEARDGGDTEAYEKIIADLASAGYERTFVERKMAENTVSGGTDEESEEVFTNYSSSDIVTAFGSGDVETAYTIINELVEVKTKNNIAKGKTAEEAAKSAKSSVKSQVTKSFKEDYKAAYANGDWDELEEIVEIIFGTGLYEWESDVYDLVAGWEREYDRESEQ